MTKTQYIAIALGLTFALAARAQRDFSQVEIKAAAVAGAVHMLEGAGGNLGVSAGEDGVLLVDDQFAPLAPKIEAALKRLNPGALHFVLNTHWHGDHTGGNEHFGKLAPIIAHANVRKRLAAKTDAPIAKEALPEVTFEQGLSIHFNGEEIQVIALPPGHTDGDSVVVFTRSNVIHAGDQFFNGQFPFIDLDSGGDVPGYLRNVESLLKLAKPDTRIIPGHGPLAGVDDLKRFQAMLLETTGLVRDAIAAGKTLEEVKAAGLPAKWADWGKGFISTPRWLEITYRGLKR